MCTRVAHVTAAMCWCMAPSRNAIFFFFSSRRRHTRFDCDWSSDVCSSDLYYHNRESTDDAQVDGHITPMASKVYGRVAEVLVDDNQHVKAGQVLVKIDPRDYQTAADEAKEIGRASCRERV